MNILADLFLTFAKIGCFTFGGGYAMISLIEDACVEKKKWITYDDMMDMTVIAESTPGPIAINCATFVGYRQYGLKGAAAATIGMVLPSFLIIFFISHFLDHFLEIGWITDDVKKENRSAEYTDSRTSDRAYSGRLGRITGTKR